MLQLVFATVVAIFLIGKFGRSSDGVLWRMVERIAFWLVFCVISIPIALWVLVNIGPFVIMVLLIFVVLRLAISSGSVR